LILMIKPRASNKWHRFFLLMTKIKYQHNAHYGSLIIGTFRWSCFWRVEQLSTTRTTVHHFTLSIARDQHPMTWLKPRGVTLHSMRMVEHNTLSGENQVAHYRQLFSVITTIILPSICYPINVGIKYKMTLTPTKWNTNISCLKVII
jgi:hypothetical protein